MNKRLRSRDEKSCLSRSSSLVKWMICFLKTLPAGIIHVDTIPDQREELFLPPGIDEVKLFTSCSEVNICWCNSLHCDRNGQQCVFGNGELVDVAQGQIQIRHIDWVPDLCSTYSERKIHNTL